MAERDECLNWIKERINEDMIDEDERMNFQAFQRVLENTDVLENHSGRFLLIRKGLVWEDTFGSPQDTFSEEFDDECILFRIPTDVHSNDTAIFATSTVGETNGTFNEIIVPVKLMIKKIPIGYTGPQDFQGDFMVDTGASDTSCPCYVGDLTNQSLSGPDNDGKYSITGTWNMLAFWGKQKLACRKQPTSVHTANGKFTTKKLHFDKGQLSMIVGDSEEVEVKGLLMPPDLKKDFKRTAALKDQPLEPPQWTNKLLLGRDILFKHFTTTISKEVEKNTTVTFNKREHVTPPASPSFGQRILNTIRPSSLSEIIGRWSKF